MSRADTCMEGVRKVTFVASSTILKAVSLYICISLKAQPSVTDLLQR